MTTKTCTNGHTMTGIGFDECPECEAPWTATQTVEEIMSKKTTDWLLTYGKSCFKAGAEEGVKAEWERCKDLVTAHLRTNTYEGNDARIFKTTVEEVVGLLSDKK